MVAGELSMNQEVICQLQDMARRGGVKRNSGLIYEETRSVLAKRKTVSAIVLYTRSSATAVP